MDHVAEVVASDQPDPNSTPNNHVPTEDDQASVTLTLLADLVLAKTGDSIVCSTNTATCTVTWTSRSADGGSAVPSNFTVPDKRAVLSLPSIGQLVLLVAAPRFARVLAVEKKFPAGSFFGVSELIEGCVGRERGGERDSEKSGKEEGFHLAHSARRPAIRQVS